jgi:hypothetical protein
MNYLSYMNRGGRMKYSNDRAILQLVHAILLDDSKSFNQSEKIFFMQAERLGRSDAISP